MENTNTNDEIKQKYPFINTEFLSSFDQEGCLSLVGFNCENFFIKTYPTKDEIDQTCIICKNNHFSPGELLIFYNFPEFICYLKYCFFFQKEKLVTNEEIFTKNQNEIQTKYYDILKIPAIDFSPAKVICKYCLMKHLNMDSCLDIFTYVILENYKDLLDNENLKNLNSMDANMLPIVALQSNSVNIENNPLEFINKKTRREEKVDNCDDNNISFQKKNIKDEILIKNHFLNKIKKDEKNKKIGSKNNNKKIEMNKSNNSNNNNININNNLNNNNNNINDIKNKTNNNNNNNNIIKIPNVFNKQLYDSSSFNNQINSTLNTNINTNLTNDNSILLSSYSNLFNKMNNEMNKSLNFGKIEYNLDKNMNVNNISSNNLNLNITEIEKELQDINEINTNEKQAYDNHINSLIEQLIIPKVFHTQSKIIFQQNLDSLCSLITDLTLIIYLINKESKGNFNPINIEYYYKMLTNKAYEINPLLEKISIIMKDYNDNILSFEKIIQRLEQVFINNYFPMEQFECAKEIFLKEYETYKENSIVFSKFKNYIPSLFYEALVNTDNQKKLYEIFNKVSFLSNVKNENLNFLEPPNLI